MNLDDLQKPMSASAISKLLKKHYGLQAPIEEMSNKQAKKILENVQAKLSKIRNSKIAHLAEKHQSYNALLLTEQMLSKKLNEGERWSNFKTASSELGSPVEPLKTAVGQAYDTAKSALKTIPGANVSSPVSYDSIFRSLKSTYDTYKQKSPSEYVKILRDNGFTKSEFDKYFDKLQKTKSADHIPMNKREQFYSTLRSLESAGNRLQGKTSDLDAIANSLVNLVKSNNPPVVPTPAAKIKESNMRYQQFRAKKRKIYESAMSEAEVVLAAKDIADRFQDMVESLGKMVNEELPALVETIRDSMGAEQAESYNSSAIETINSALENIRVSKDSLDSAARVLAGEEAGAAPVDMGIEPIGGEEDLDASAGEELDQVPAAASGGEEEPLGRGER